MVLVLMMLDLLTTTADILAYPGNGEGELLCYDPKLNTTPTPTGITMSVRGALSAVESDGALAYLVMCVEPGVRVIG